MHTADLRREFAAALSDMYGAEVPAYTTLVEVTTAVNADVIAAGAPADELARVTAERHGAIRVGTPDELRDVADLFAAFGMHPVGTYDLRDGPAPVPVVSTAFRPIEPDQLAHNPFRVFTSMLALDDRRFFPADLAQRLDQFLRRRQLFDPHLVAQARQIARDGGIRDEPGMEFVRRATAAFALSCQPIDQDWFDELTAISPVAADIGATTRTHINHLTPRVLDIDELYRRMGERGITMIDAIQGPPRWSGPDVLLRQTSFRALAEPRRFRTSSGAIVDGSVRVRFGEVEQRGTALTPAGRDRYDAAMAAADVLAHEQSLPWAQAAQRVWPEHFPATVDELLRGGLGYFTAGGTADNPVLTPTVYEDFLPRSAAGIFASNLDGDTARGVADEAPRYDAAWFTEQLNRTVHEPFTLYQRIQDDSLAALGITSIGDSA